MEILVDNSPLKFSSLKLSIVNVKNLHEILPYVVITHYNFDFFKPLTLYARLLDLILITLMTFGPHNQTLH